VRLPVNSMQSAKNQGTECESGILRAVCILLARYLIWIHTALARYNIATPLSPLPQCIVLLEWFYESRSWIKQTRKVLSGMQQLSRKFIALRPVRKIGRRHLNTSLVKKHHLAQERNYAKIFQLACVLKSTAWLPHWKIRRVRNHLSSRFTDWCPRGACNNRLICFAGRADIFSQGVAEGVHSGPPI